MSIADQIITYKDWNRLEDYRSLIARHAGGRLPELDPASLLEPPVYAYVNQGRWVGECPTGCNAALLLDPDDPYFYCYQCRDGWRAVEYPQNRAEIEAELLKRPLVAHTPINRNWTPGEALSDLQADNARHGIRG